MHIYAFYDAEDSQSWRQEPNFSQFGYDLTPYTETTISFSDLSSTIYLNTFLLEFVIEVDLVLRRRCGQNFFEAHAALQYSGNSVLFKRNGDLLEVQISGLDEKINYSWKDFLRCFKELKQVGYQQLRGYYPNISKFAEIEFIFKS